jgi:hypothetical protein
LLLRKDRCRCRWDGIIAVGHYFMKPM